MLNELFAITDEVFNSPETVTANRLSIIDGKVDFTQYSNIIAEEFDVFIARYSQKAADKSDCMRECISKIVTVEVLYQRNECYKALVMGNSALAFLEKDGNENIWIVGRFFQMCIMIVTGQLRAIYPLVDGMQERIYKSENEGLIDTYEALRAWCALYDDDWETVDKWMSEMAPNEYNHICIDRIVCYMVKARVYYMQGRYFAAINLLQSLECVLKENNRNIELSEMYLLQSISHYADNHMEEAYNYFEKSVEIAELRGCVRLLADEGEPVYRLARNYRKNLSRNKQSDKFLQDVIRLSKEMALTYPKYLKNHKADYPKLTQKEIEVLRLLADGRSNIEIADFLDNSLNTIKYHIKNIYIKLGVKNRKEAVKVATEDRLI